MIKPSLLLLILFIGSLAQADPLRLLVSDIDDTLKVSGGGSIAFAGARALGREAFPGIAAVYRALAEAHPELQFQYVSRAPSEVLLTGHAEFLELNGFPRGGLHLPTLSEREGFKVREISKLLTARKEGLVILIGDNKEQDLTVYREIRATFEPKGFRFLTYIHAVKPEVPLAFVRTPTTSALRYHDADELAADLRSQGFLP